MLGTRNWLAEKLQRPVGDGFLHDLLDNLYDGLFIATAEREIVYWNRGAERITGFTAREVIGRRCNDELLVHTDANGAPLRPIDCPLEAALRERAPHTRRAYSQHKSGRLVPIAVRTVPIFSPAGELAGVAETFSDESENRQLRQEVIKLAEAATTDPLTGLPNRRAFDEALDLAFYRSARHGFPFGLILLDLDHFKDVNDTYGHQVGDALLQSIARTLSFVRRRDELAARWGGEEFAVLVQPVDGLEHLLAAAQRLRQVVATTRVSAGVRLVSVTASAGATLARESDNPMSLLERADALLYRSKDEGRDRALVG